MRITNALAVSTLAALLLSACASIPLKSVYNLWNFDPWASDFRLWRAAVRLPEGRGVSLDQARIIMTVETWRSNDKSPQIETFVLVRSLEPADLAPLAAERRPGFVLAAFRFSPSDHTRMETLRARILAAKESNTHKKGALSITASSCGGATDATVEGSFPFSTFLMVDAKDGYNPMLVDYDLGPELRKISANPTSSVLCTAGK